MEQQQTSKQTHSPRSKAEQTDSRWRSSAFNCVSSSDLPSDPLLRDYWVYEGSLTTPPCSEKVTWILFRYPLTISQIQVSSNQEPELLVGFIPFPSIPCLSRDAHDSAVLKVTSTDVSRQSIKTQLRLRR